MAPRSATTQLNATASFSGNSVPGAFVYAPAAGTVLNAGNNQTLAVSFTPTDTANFNSANASAQINVLKATPQINWSNPADITYGTALGQLATQRDGFIQQQQRAWRFRLRTSGKHDSERGQQINAGGQLHADRCRQLQWCKSRVCISMF